MNVGYWKSYQEVRSDGSLKRRVLRRCPTCHRRTAQKEGSIGAHFPNGDGWMIPRIVADVFWCSGCGNTFQVEATESIGIEIDERFCEMAAARLTQEPLRLDNAKLSHRRGERNHEQKAKR